MSIAEQICGRLVSDEDMHPACNIAGRRWITRSGDLHGTFNGFWPTPDGLRPPGLVWVFEDEAGTEIDNKSKQVVKIRHKPFITLIFFGWWRT